MATEEPVRPGRRTVFGEVAEVYDAFRPGYCDDLVSQVLAYAGLDGRPAVEVGAGTGKATVLFAERGVRLTCVEPDPRMAEVLRRNTAGYPDVRVEVSDFERWQRDGRRFRLLFAATCWHWVAPERRWDLAHAALEPGGAVALFWNQHGISDDALYDELSEVDRYFGIDHSPHRERACDFGDQPGVWGREDQHWPTTECLADGRFTDLRSLRFRQDTRYGTEHYLGYLSSISAYRILPDDRREAVLDATGQVLEAHGGGIGMCHVSDLFLARAS